LRFGSGRLSWLRVKLLFIGDIVGEPGRRAVAKLVPKLRAEHQIDVVIANGENSAGGAGITPGTAEEIFGGGVDIITCGDHLWDQKEVTQLLLQEPRFVRPLNYPSGTIGQGSTLFQKEGQPLLGVINVQGRTFMAPLENPFTAIRSEVNKLRQSTHLIFVDFHAEATSEKIAMGRYLDGDVSAVVGTHTHVQTADDQIFPKGTAYLTDAGFTGPHESIIGRNIEPVVQRFLTLTPQRFGIASERVTLQGVVIDIDNDSGHAKSILRISEALPEHA
jgi:2',3'-cyclic-nucleotide 2'-phosphodiesterase